MQRVITFLESLGQHLGGPGLAIVAFADSSFLSLPKVADALTILQALRDPSAWWYYGLMTTAGSLAGCWVLYELGRRGGEAFLRRRFAARHVERGLALFRRHRLLAIAVPAILPPPAPFKIFVLLAGVAGVRRRAFLAAVVAGRGVRYLGEAWLAVRYGDRVGRFLAAHGAELALWLAASLGAAGALLLMWRRLRPA